MHQPSTQPVHLKNTLFACLPASTPYPTGWNDRDKFNHIDISNNGQEAKFTGPIKGGEQEAASVRADAPMPPACGIFYFEVEILSKGKEGYIGIGFCKETVKLNRLPGWETDSWGYHGDDGHSFCCQGTGKKYGPQFTAGDIIGCGVNFRDGTAFYTKNGNDLGVAFKDIKGKLFPFVGMRTYGEHVRVNFGATPFIYDIDYHIRREKRILFDVANVQYSSHGESARQAENYLTAQIQSLVRSYLSHNGYAESSQAFLRGLEEKNQALGQERDVGFATEDTDTINRQRIRAAILEGDIDKAIKLTTVFYPHVLEENESIRFQLRCRKFVEMMRVCAECEDAYMPDVDPSLEEAATEGEDTKASLLVSALQYGQSLQEDYRNDPRKEVHDTLKQTFSLLAYPDPRTSVVAHLLEEKERLPVAEQLNSDILVSLGRSAVAPLERLMQQTQQVTMELVEAGDMSAAFVNVQRDFA